MAKLNSELILTLDDRVSKPSREVERRLDSLRQQQERHQRQFEHHRNAFVATAATAVAAAAAFQAPVRASMQFQDSLEDVRQTAELTREEIQTLGMDYRKVGVDTAQGADAIVEANKVMLASGAVTAEQANIMSTAIGKTATAYNASIADVSSTGTSMIQNLGITAEETGLALDYLAKSGKLGAFELADMATEFPAVTSQAAALGMAGLDAAASLGVWLQIARKGKATGSEAATAMRGFMQQLTMPATVERFKQEGVDVIAEIKKAAEAGADPIAHIVGILEKLTGGDATKLTDFFREEGALSFANQAMKRLEEYEAMRAEVYGGAGTVEQDFLDRMETPGAIMARFNASVQELQLSVGDTLVPKLMEFIKTVTPMVDSVSDFVKANDKLVAAVIEITAALLGLKLLGHAGGMAGALLGLKGGKGAPALPVGVPGVGKGAKGPGAPGFGAGQGDDLVGLVATIRVLAPWVADRLGTAIFDNLNGEGASAQAKEITGGAWDRTVERFQDWWTSSQVDTGLITPTQDAAATPQAQRIAALEADIARLETANLPGPQVELHFMKAELEELKAAGAQAGVDTGQAIATGIEQQDAAAASALDGIMSMLRNLAGAGVDVPVRPAAAGTVTTTDVPGYAAGGYTGNGGVNDVAGLVHGREFVVNAAATRLHRPMLEALNSGLSLPTPRAWPTATPSAAPAAAPSQSIGDIVVNVEVATNADPNTIARAVGEVVSRHARAAFSNGAMGL